MTEVATNDRGNEASQRKTSGMSMKAILLAVCLSAIAPASAFAFGAIGCTDLPEHDRAVGALEGMTGACDMSVEQARHILARDGGQPDAVPHPRRRHRRTTQQP